MDLYAFKKFVSAFLYPLPLLIAVVVFGLLLYALGKIEPKAVGTARADAWTRDSVDRREKIRRRRRRRGVFGMTLVWVALLLMYLLGLAPISRMLVQPLEQRFPVLDAAAEELQSNPPAYIVVLGGGYARANGLPVTSRLASSSLIRVTEAARLHRAFPEALMIITGGDHIKGEDRRPTVADGMAEIAKLMGVPAEQLLLERDSRTSSDHPAMILPLLGDERRILLVTSAVHMPRSMAMFTKQGFSPIAAPAGFTPPGRIGFEISDCIPSSKSYARLDAAVHEYIALLWARWRGQID